MPRQEVTDLLAAWRQGRDGARDELFDRVYGELRRIAGAQVRLQPATMAPTELVHETYLKLIGSARVSAVDRGHFFSLAARAMRQILVDSSRRRRAAKRGGLDQKIGLDEVAEPAAPFDEDQELLALEEALQQLAERSPRLVRLVELRHFAGLPMEEIAEVLEVSSRTLRRDWRTARAFLHARMRGGPVPAEGGTSVVDDPDGQG
ncbi:MAG: RNA polymerase subunit sigma-70 [Acidobacteria bacterium]|nr:MAG: RNA polymerase subunit sigma-70 [Acidobacteriota bacterium]REK11353.1 MAG: RNA polymerase subunit sigma-70 [Acidobacteriota bacterium]